MKTELINKYTLEVGDTVYLDVYSREKGEYEVLPFKLGQEHLAHYEYQEEVRYDLIIGETVITTNDSIYKFAEYYPLYSFKRTLEGAGMGMHESIEYEKCITKGYALTEESINRIIDMRNGIIRSRRLEKEAREEASKLAEKSFKEEYERILKEKMKEN